MSESKIELTVGAVSFSGEGNEKWVAEQLDKILENVPDLLRVKPQIRAHQPKAGTPTSQHEPMSPAPDIAKKTLPAFLTEKNATTIQVKKFLATAVWLEAKGKARMTTRDVSSALKKAKQKSLSNPADCLNQNIKKGYCEKDGSEFFVIETGKNSL